MSTRSRRLLKLQANNPAKKPSAFDLRRLVGSVNQLRFNDNRGEVAFFGQKMIILRRDVIRVMREALEKIVGDQAAPFLSFLASGVGIHEGSIFRDSVTSTGQEQRMSLENLVRSAFEDTNLGLGKIQIRRIDFDTVTANVTVANCFEAMENGPADQPNCMFTSGFLAGLFAEVFDKTIQTKETRCISQGQPECEFELSSVDGPDIPSAERNEPAPKENVVDTHSVEKKADASTTIPVKIETPSPTVQVESKAPAPIGSKESMDAPSKISKDQVDSGVERATRIAKRKQGFWEKHFKKN